MPMNAGASPVAAEGAAAASTGDDVDVATFWSVVEQSAHASPLPTSPGSVWGNPETPTTGFSQGHTIGSASPQGHAARFISAISRKAAQRVVKAQERLEASGTEADIVCGPCFGDRLASCHPGDRAHAVARRMRCWTWLCIVMGAYLPTPCTCSPAILPAIVHT